MDRQALHADIPDNSESDLAFEEEQEQPGISPEPARAGFADLPVEETLSDGGARPALESPRLSADAALAEPVQLTSAEIVGDALQFVVSNLVGTVLEAAVSGKVQFSEVGAKATTVAPGEEDHSYQWHALQNDDNDAAPTSWWGQDEVVESVQPAVQSNTTAAAGEVQAAIANPMPAAIASTGKRQHETASTKLVEASDELPKGANPAPPSESNSPDAAETASNESLEYESRNDPDQRAVASRGGGGTISILCAGIGVIACCLLIPLCDANRHAAYDKLCLRRDLESLQLQVATNDQFLHKVANDPTLAERLAQRQLKKIRAGTHIVPLRDDAGQNAADFGSASPFGIVAVPPPPPQAPYQPLGGRIATICYNPHSRLYLMGAGMMLLAAGLVMGYGPLGVRRATGIEGE